MTDRKHGHAETSNARIYARALRSGIPVPGRGVRRDTRDGSTARTGDKGAGASVLPNVAVTRRVSIAREAVARFGAIVGEPLRDVVPASYVHTLGFMPAMEAMTAPGFPAPVLGMVHTYNTFIQHRPVHIGDVLELTVTLGRARAHKRGTLIPVRVAGVTAGAPTFEEECLYLAKGRQLVGLDVAESEESRLPFTPEARPTALWRLQRDVAPAYARASGDLNPIHLNRLAAKAFGFPSTIAHGMYTAARGLAQLDVRAESFRWEVQFASPLVLPATVGFSATTGGGYNDDPGARTTSYQVFNPRKKKPYVVGLVTTGERALERF